MPWPNGGQITTPEAPLPSTPHNPESAPDSPVVSPQAARRILISMLFPQMLMPMVSTMSRVALPVIRDEFTLTADVTAWVAIVFTLPYMMFMPVYGRLSDGLDRRRLIMVGTAIFTIGTALAAFSSDLGWLMAGRAIQGFGVAGMMPLGMALISSIYPADRRGAALGSWAAVGPGVGFFGPLAAGFLVAAFGWRGAIAPPVLFGAIAFFTVAYGVPTVIRHRPERFLRSFDWLSVVLLSVGLVSFAFFLSSRSITDHGPLTDWRLGGITLFTLLAFVIRQKRHRNPFVDLAIFSGRAFRVTTFCAAMRMVGMGGLGFLVPLYLVDIHALHPATLGSFLMINSGAMALVTRYGGTLSDRIGTRTVAVVGLAIQASAIFLISRLSVESSLWAIGSLLALHGLGVGIILAALHHSAMSSLPDELAGSGAGVYSMFRFLAAAVGTAIAGVLLQAGIDAQLPAIESYRYALLILTIFPILGSLGALRLQPISSQTAQ